MSLISETPLGTPFVPNESITDSAYSFAASSNFCFISISF